MSLFDVEVDTCDMFKGKIEDIKKYDFIYVTRVQHERSTTSDKALIDFDHTNFNRTLNACRPDCKIFHPLPRSLEFPVSWDEDPRTCCWKQVKNSIPVRQAILLACSSFMD